MSTQDELLRARLKKLLDRWEVDGAECLEKVNKDKEREHRQLSIAERGVLIGQSHAHSKCREELNELLRQIITPPPSP